MQSGRLCRKSRAVLHPMASRNNSEVYISEDNIEENDLSKKEIATDDTNDGGEILKKSLK